MRSESGSKPTIQTQHLPSKNRTDIPLKTLPSTPYPRPSQPKQEIKSNDPAERKSLYHREECTSSPCSHNQRPEIKTHNTAERSPSIIPKKINTPLTLIHSIHTVPSPPTIAHSIDHSLTEFPQKLITTPPFLIIVTVQSVPKHRPSHLSHYLSLDFMLREKQRHQFIGIGIRYLAWNLDDDKR